MTTPKLSIVKLLKAMVSTNQCAPPANPTPTDSLGFVQASTPNGHGMVIFHFCCKFFFCGLRGFFLPCSACSLQVYPPPPVIPPPHLQPAPPPHAPKAPKKNFLGYTGSGVGGGTGLTLVGTDYKGMGGVALHVLPPFPHAPGVCCF